jgi:hypothetical protein
MTPMPYGARARRRDEIIPVGLPEVSSLAGLELSTVIVGKNVDSGDLRRTFLNELPLSKIKRT